MIKSYWKLTAFVIAALALLLTGSNLLLRHTDRDSGRNRPYRVEAERIALRIENGEAYDLADYPAITRVEIIADADGYRSDSDYLVKEIGGRLYRFDYTLQAGSAGETGLFNILSGAVCAFVLALLAYVYFAILRPFARISDYPAELVKGHLTSPLRESRTKYFGQFLWGLDLLREKLEKEKSAALELQRQNKTMLLSLSHDMKTPLGVIELYAKALEKGLYSDEEKKRDVVRSMTAKCEEIRGYVDEIVKASGDDFLNFEIKPGEFYLSALIGQIRDFYRDKLDLLQIGFHIDSFSDCLLSGDAERAVEVLQNIIENAVKYGDGKRIEISFSREEDCQLVRISNTGCTLSDNELPHIFESFWRGSNVGSTGGSGLGLYICRTLMRRMNGDIFAQTRDGEMTVTAVFALA